jgi:hypothetical protein
MAESEDDFEDLDEYDEEQDIDGESGTFVDPGVEDEDVPEDEALWDLPPEPRSIGDEDDE